MGRRPKWREGHGWPVAAGAAGQQPEKTLGHVFRKNRKAVAAAGPARARVPEDAGLGFKRRLVVQRTGGDHDEIRLLYVARHLAAAGRAEVAGETLGLGNLIHLDQFFALEPLQRSGLEE